MIYLTGVISTAITPVIADRPDFGMLAQPDGRAHGMAAFRHWAADNGCFAAADEFDLPRWLAWLDRQDRARCLFAACPDVVGDPAATEARSTPVVPTVRDLGYPAAYVAQDGLTPATTPWDLVDALFIGGSTTWKLSADAHRLVDAAHDRGRWVHMGRVNTWRRIRTAASWGCDSVDGTLLAFGADFHLPRLVAWMDSLHATQLALPPT